MSLEVDEKYEGVMRLLYAAVKSLPKEEHNRFYISVENGLMVILIIADANAVGSVEEYVDIFRNT